MYVECRGDYLCPGIDRVRMVWREGSGREGCVLWPGPKEHSRSARGDERSIMMMLGLVLVGYHACVALSVTVAIPTPQSR